MRNPNFRFNPIALYQMQENVMSICKSRDLRISRLHSNRIWNQIGRIYRQGVMQKFRYNPKPVLNRNVKAYFKP